MRISCLTFLFAVTSLFPFQHADACGAETDRERAKKILREVDDMWRGKSSRVNFSMKVKTANYSRSLTMERWSKGKDKTLVRIISPLKEKGTATLKYGNTIFTYLPKSDRTIRLASGMMMGSWMGSHFTNDDLARGGGGSRLYTCTATG